MSRLTRLLMVACGVVLGAIFVLFIYLSTQHSADNTAGGIVAANNATATAFIRTPGNSVPTPTRAPYTSPIFAPLSRNAQAKAGGNISTAIVAEPRTLQPYLADDPDTQQATALLYNAGLVRRDPTTQAMIPLAARTYTLSPDGRTVTFTLRDDITWSDGQPITSDDYSWTYAQLTNPANGWAYLGDYASRIVSYTAPDPKTVVVQLKDAVANPADLANIVEPLPRHIWQNLDWRDPKASNTPQVVSGPWKLSEWVKGDHISFARNETSSVWPAPLLTSLTMHVVADPAVAAQGMAAGTYDYLTPDATNFATVRNLSNTQSYTWSPAAAQWLYLGFNVRRPALTPALRQAIALAVDKKALADAASTPAEPLFSDVPPGNIAYNTKNATQQSTANLVAAKKSLTDGGYTQDAAGAWKDSKGVAVPSIILLYGGTPDSDRAKVAATLHDQIAKLGLNVTVQGADVPTYHLRLTTAPYDYDLWLGGWQSPAEASDFGETWLSPALNYGAYKDEMVTGLYAAAKIEFDPTRHKMLLAQMQQAEAKDPPYVYLYALKGAIIANTRIAGITATPYGADANLMVDWYIAS